MEKFNTLASLRTLLIRHPELEKILKKYLCEQKLTSDERNFLLNDLSVLLLNESLTLGIANLFSPVLLDLLTRASDVTKDDPITKHEWLCICLSKLIWYFPDVVRFAKLYFEKSFGFFCRFEDEADPPAKKFKSDAIPMQAPQPHQLLLAANMFLIYDAQSFKEIADWSVIVSFLDAKELYSRWFAYHIIARVGNVKQFHSILKMKFTKEQVLECLAVEDRSQIWTFKQFRPCTVYDCSDMVPRGAKLQRNDFSKEIVCVEGVLLNRNPDCQDYLNKEKFVNVPSVQRSLYRLALAVSAGEPVLLQGPVGCGKTSIIEHLAVLTGRRPFEELLKVQLGDHMDSKMLLGTHCCTEVPGEFVWKSGILIQAMTEGHWLLLEDIDCAPMDVISLLVPVLQSRTVSLPGHSNTIKAAPGFQLFATQRLIRGFEGSYVEFRSNTHVIESHFRKVLMEPLSKNELKRIICTRWPPMEKWAEKILELYSLFSLDLIVDKGNWSVSSIEPFNLDCRHGRLVSTRDLFKFCERISGYPEPKKDTLASVFRNAVECFCDSIPSFTVRMSAAERLGVKINIPSSKANYLLCHSEKPIHIEDDKVLVGRVALPRLKRGFRLEREVDPVFAFTKQSTMLLEKIAVAVSRKEPVLLVGETGTGKTSVVQYLAHLTRHKLTVINMSQQSDSVDLIGGYKPVDLDLAVQPLKDQFFSLFTSQDVVNCDKNNKFLHHISTCLVRKKYDYAAELMYHAQQNVLKMLLEKQNESSGELENISAWRKLGEQISTLKHQVNQSKNTLIFKFIEGALVKAMKKGEWLLLDEINLAEAETLECLAGILENDENTLFLYEKGSKEPVTRHPDFRIFACMNPATDVGKKDLPVGIRNRFTEFFVDEIEEKQDLTKLVQEYLKTLNLQPSCVDNIVKFYLYIREIAPKMLNDGNDSYPHYSLRTLCRALKYASKNPCLNVPRSLYEAFCFSFLSQLDNVSHDVVLKIIHDKLLSNSIKKITKHSIPEPRNGKFIFISGYWIRSGNAEPNIIESYIFTKTVSKNLQDLARIVSASQYPVLLQGETSVGKTSLIQWLAKASGNICVRINNHEHTDIQEYVGSYSADSTGKLVFKEGILAEAMRRGYWIILDELNLAPTEVMEALNRVLDDNRELFIPETQTLIKAHPGFMVFATQNPPGSYGGRKVLSRAFRNRFIELHFNEIPLSELEEIVSVRCGLAKSHAKLLINVMRELQIQRTGNNLFSGKKEFMTLRDLFRWGFRYHSSYDPKDGYDNLQVFSDEGYMLLAGRVRTAPEALLIQNILFKHFRRFPDPEVLFSLNDRTSPSSRRILNKILGLELSDNFKSIVWTFNMRRLAVLVTKALSFDEPVLLVGTTGSGKTTVCQLIAQLQKKYLYSVNCHMHSDSADFLGGLRPVRDHEQKELKLFEWVDGPLIKAMKQGNYFLSDEISLADDSVLERLNSVLEPERTIFVPERNVDSADEFQVTAEEGFFFFATMNPGGDYGKKELSPALRNRFTEIWCPSSMDFNSDVISIIEHNINKKLKFKRYAKDNTSGFGYAIAEFVKFYSETDVGRRTTLSIRDVLTWVEFINMSPKFVYKKVNDTECMTPVQAYLHGAFLAIIDAVGSGAFSTSNEEYIMSFRKHCYNFLKQQVAEVDTSTEELMMPEKFVKGLKDLSFTYDGSLWGLAYFYVECGPLVDESWAGNYILNAEVTKSNALKILRAMQLPKPILLEGSPGVGKTSLVSVLAKATGHGLVRINLSEQTDITDLFGADLPVDGGENGEFAWRDGPLILALKRGDWILLDELNLASQSVLEGLNACLDHRSQIFIPELGKSFYLDKTTSRVFGCQNPQRQGGSRKGLPQSFLNRFTQVYMKSLSQCDMDFITGSVYQDKIDYRLISTMVQFNYEVFFEVNINRSYGHQGSPWEFNLRDVFRWCDLLVANQKANEYNIGEYVKLIYVDRMRNIEDKGKILYHFEDVLKRNGLLEHRVENRILNLNVFENCVQVGYSFLPSKRLHHTDSKMTCIVPAQYCYLESLMKCIEMNWMAILVGPSGSGKSTLVRCLAELCGQELHVLSVNSEMDTIELLGGFEQADINRQIEFIAQDLQPIIEECIHICLRTGKDKQRELQDILYQQHNLQMTICSGASLQQDNWSKKLNCLKELIKNLESFKTESVFSVLVSCKKALHQLIKKVKAKKSFGGGKFEWVDSMLINAAQKGHWLLIDDANFCSSSVLDRLNALLEPGGVLTINEQGIVNGCLRTIVPHKDFRIILTVNPKNGEISRAMRNRGIEIYVEPLAANFMKNPQAVFSVSSFAHCKGLIHNELLHHFFALYHRLSTCEGLAPPTLSDLLSAMSLCVQMIQKHGNAYQAFRDSCVAVFVENHLNASSRNLVLKVVDVEISTIRELKPDYSVSITELLPSSFDYQQNFRLSALKKQSCLFTIFYKEFAGRLFNCPVFLYLSQEEKEKQQVVPLIPPGTFYSLLQASYDNDVRVFTSVSRIMYESSSTECLQYLTPFLLHWLKTLYPKLEGNERYRYLCSRCNKYQEIMVRFQSSPLMKNLKQTTSEMVRHSGFKTISVDEMPCDLRWNPYLYQRLMLVQNDPHLDSTILEFNSRANRCSLLLLYESLEFQIDSPVSPGCQNLASHVIELANKKADNTLLEVQVLGVFEDLGRSILKYMRDESIPCSDEFYWKLFEIISSHHHCRKVAFMHAERGMVPQARILSLHVCWLLKKVNQIEKAFGFSPSGNARSVKYGMQLANSPPLIFRHKCVKLLGYPPFLALYRNFELVKSISEFFQMLNVAERLKSQSTTVKDLKIIFTNMRKWLTGIGRAATTNLYESPCHLTKGFTFVNEIRAQMIDTGIINVDDDDIMDICQNPAEQSIITDVGLSLDIQLLPLQDYLFVLYEAEMLSRAIKFQDIYNSPCSKFLFWAAESLGLNPFHYAHLTVLLQFKDKRSLIPALFYYLRHARHGYSSDTLSALNFVVKDNAIHFTEGINKNWNKEYSWPKQFPLLTHILSSLFGKSNKSSFMCHFPLGSHFEKIYQLKKAQVFIWEHFDRLADIKRTYRYHASSIVISWFNNLLSAMVTLSGESPATITYDMLKSDKNKLLILADKLGISGYLVTTTKKNILLIAADSIIELEALLEEEVVDSKLSAVTGKAYVLVGLLTSVILCPRDLMDVAFKAKVKLAEARDNCNLLYSERDLRRWMYNIVYGQSLQPDWIPEHPHVKVLKDLCAVYDKKIQYLEARSHWFRAENEEFENLKKDCKEFLDTQLLCPELVLDVMMKLNSVNMGSMQDFNQVEKDSNRKGLKPFLIAERARTHSLNLHSYVDTILRKYSTFQDITLPFLVGVEQIIFGFQMASHTVILKETVNNDPPTPMNSLNDLLWQYSCFTTEILKSPLDIASKLLSNETLKHFTKVFALAKEYFPNSRQLFYKLIKSAILELNNVIKCQTYHPDSKLIEIKELLFSAFHSFYKSWQIQDEIKKRKMAEEAELIKMKVYEGELSDEEKLEKELKEMFPYYDEDFDDLIVKGPLDSDKAGPSSTGTSQEASSVVFTDYEMFEVCQLHASVMALLSDLNTAQHDSNLYVKHGREVDIVTPILLRHEFISSIITSLGHRIDSSFEKSLIKEQLLLCKELQKLVGLEEDEYYDIYHDPNPAKVVTINGLLQNLVNRVSFLLQQFPENPNLVQILTVTERVLSFPVSDPLMKFVIGMEMVLEAAQLWEKNAHSKVSIKPEIDVITEKIILFRAMELNMWKKGLQNVIKKQYVKSAKWWFFMFPLFYADNTYAESEKAVIKKGLQQCLEDSPIGEFPARLSILRTFLQEFHVCSPAKQNRSYANILFNVYTYYEQFLPAIEKEIAQIRKPIEKDLKDFVKIARWNDINFYAVKASVEKSHRAVLRHVKAFENALQKPAKTVFILPSKKPEDVENSWSLDITEKDFLYDVPRANLRFFKFRREPFFQKFPRYQNKVKKICKQIAENFPVAGYVNTLNDFCGNIIEALESATMDGQKVVCTRSREKKQALLKIQNKKQMLSTLFKSLKAIGLSYRQGMMNYHEDRVTELMSVPAFDVSRMKILKFDHSFKDLLSQSSCDTNHYFYKSLAQFAQLQKLMESPSKDLTLDIVHRIQGYGGHLLTLISAQRIEIVKLMTEIDIFGRFLSIISTVYEKQDFAYEKNLTIIPPQNYFQEQNLEISNFIETILLAVNQFDALLDCAPEPRSSEPHLPELNKNSFSNVLKDTDAWLNLKKAVNMINCDIKNLFHQLSAMKIADSVASWDHLRTFSSICKSIQKSIGNLLMEISKYCDVRSPMVKNLLELYHTANCKCTATKEEEDRILDSHIHREVLEESRQSRSFAKSCKKLATQVILGIQELLVFSSATEEDKSDYVVPDNLFTSKITGALEHSKVCLHFESILKIFKKLKRKFGHFEGHTESVFSYDKSFRLLVNLAPILNQYYQLLKAYLAISLGMHRTSCKFLTILLEIFSLLATKGFCIPPELEEEAAKAGATKFEDIESGGLGEGEGSKDVSSKIESEDQLDDTMKEGQDKKENESKDKELKDEQDGIEMSEDFEGKLHSGEGDEENSDDNEDKQTEDLDKQMGDVESDEAEKLDDRVWGDDSEEEGELRDEDGTGGMTDKMQSELVAKDDKPKEDAEEDKTGKRDNVQDIAPDELNDEYEGENPDPMINAPPVEEPEVVDLPDELEITDEVEPGAEGENYEEMDEPEDESNYSEDGDLSEEGENSGDDEDEGTDKNAQEDVEGEEKEGGNVADQEEVDQAAQDSAEQNDSILPTQAPTDEVQALPASETKKSSADPVQTEGTMDWETGAQSGEDQHKEGMSDAANMPKEDSGHEGKKSTSKTRQAAESKQTPKSKLPRDNRTVDESADELNAKKRPIKDKKVKDKPPEPNEDSGEAEAYEHISKDEESKIQAMDIANQWQAEIRTAEVELMDDDEPKLIELSSDSEDEECDRAIGENLKTNQGNKPGERGNEETKDVNIPEGEVVKTQTVSRGAESLAHFSADVWKALYASRRFISAPPTLMSKANMAALSVCKTESELSWRKYEISVANFSQELCEQLRLVLEPTKMSKFKGDYRTGKRLNMRKIIPYIASQFRKDKIWLRRTKPSKREYQIMLAIDDSKSMDYNCAKDMAFQACAVLAQSLTLLEAGKLSIVRFGKDIELLHGFEDQFSSSTGANICNKVTFSQLQTNIAQLLNYATDVMVQARNNSRSITTKETAQLLIIISDGAHIFAEGEQRVKMAVKNARDNNIFMVYLILDNIDESKNSILDVKLVKVATNEEESCIPPELEEKAAKAGATKFEDIESGGLGEGEGSKDVRSKIESKDQLDDTMKEGQDKKKNESKDKKLKMVTVPYLDSFPFPFYVVLRQISALPQVLGEALRQWFELVSSVDR